MKNAKMVTFALILCMAFALLSGCSAEASAAGAVGRIIVSVNPEVAVDYDENSEVVGVEGLNDDGDRICSELGDALEGKDVSLAVGEIVDLIYSDGFFCATVNGVEKNIVVKVAPGSELPSDDLLEVIIGDVRLTVGEHGGNSTPVAVGPDDYDLLHYFEGYINGDKAEEIALAQGAAEKLGMIIDKDYDLSDGIYEVEYLLGGKLMQADVDAVTGKVISLAESVLENANGAELPETVPTNMPEAPIGTTIEEWENRSKSWECWAKDYGNGWKSWGEKVGSSFHAF